MCIKQATNLTYDNAMETRQKGPTFQDGSTIYSFSLGNKMQRVMCKSCEVQIISAVSILDLLSRTHDSMHVPLSIVNFSFTMLHHS